MTTACSGVSGGAMFVPDHIERRANKTSYKDLARTAVDATFQAAKKTTRSFGRRKAKTPLDLKPDMTTEAA